MSNAELARKLSDKTGIALPLAYDTLEKAGWDLLDAILALEREGLIAPITASASTAAHADDYDEVLPTASAGKARPASARRKKTK